MDSSDPDLSFGENGVCNYCRDFEMSPERYGKVVDPSRMLEYWVDRIKAEKGSHNCILGISGGVDSSYLAYFASKVGLNPLLVHVDNGFDSEVAKENMRLVIAKTGFDCCPLEVDFEDFRRLQVAYFRSGVLDLDVPSDYLIEALVHLKAKSMGIKYVLSGWNYSSEAFMPDLWTYRNKVDYRNMMDIYRLFSDDGKLKYIPKVDTVQFLVDKIMYRIQKVNLLNYLNFNKFEAKSTLKKEWGWHSYGDKHGENILSRFYQRYILFKKFGVDKRKAHYSNLIRSGCMTREEALKELENPPYDLKLFLEDKKTVFSKLEMEENDISWVKRSHLEFASDEDTLKLKLIHLGVKAYKKLK